MGCCVLCLCFLSLSLFPCLSIPSVLFWQFFFSLSSPACVQSNQREQSANFSCITPAARCINLSFSLSFFFLIHPSCGFGVRNRLSSVKQTSSGSVTHLSIMTDRESFQTPETWPCYCLLKQQIQLWPANTMNVLSLLKIAQGKLTSDPVYFYIHTFEVCLSWLIT